MHGRRCADCGEVYPWYLLTLDDRSARKADILKTLVHRKAGTDLVWEWIEKCDAVCLNCKAKREYERLGPWDGSEFGIWPNGKGTLRWAF